MLKHLATGKVDILHKGNAVSKESHDRLKKLFDNANTNFPKVRRSTPFAGLDRSVHIKEEDEVQAALECISLMRADFYPEQERFYGSILAMLEGFKGHTRFDHPWHIDNINPAEYTDLMLLGEAHTWVCLSRGTGRTEVLAVAWLEFAIKNPNRRLSIYGHPINGRAHSARGAFTDARDVLDGRMKDIVRRYPVLQNRMVFLRDEIIFKPVGHTSVPTAW